MPVITGLTSTQREGQTRQPKGQMTRLGSPQTTIDGWSSTIPRSGTFNNPSLRRSALVERVLAPEVSASSLDGWGLGSYGKLKYMLFYERRKKKPLKVLQEDENNSETKPNEGDNKKDE
jgi:hypothetical protein